MYWPGRVTTQSISTPLAGFADHSLSKRSAPNDAIESYLGLVSVGENDFEAINTIESDFFTPSAAMTDCERFIYATYPALEFHHENISRSM